MHNDNQIDADEPSSPAAVYEVDEIHLPQAMTAVTTAAASATDTTMCEDTPTAPAAPATLAMPLTSKRCRLGKRITAEHWDGVQNSHLQLLQRLRRHLSLFRDRVMPAERSETSRRQEDLYAAKKFLDEVHRWMVDYTRPLHTDFLRDTRNQHAKHSLLARLDASHGRQLLEGQLPLSGGDGTGKMVEEEKAEPSGLGCLFGMGCVPHPRPLDVTGDVDANRRRKAQLARQLASLANESVEFEPHAKTLPRPGWGNAFLAWSTHNLDVWARRSRPTSRLSSTASSSSTDVSLADEAAVTHSWHRRTTLPYLASLISSLLLRTSASPGVVGQTTFATLVESAFSESLNAIISQAMCLSTRLKDSVLATLLARIVTDIKDMYIAGLFLQRFPYHAAVWYTSHGGSGEYRRENATDDILFNQVDFKEGDKGWLSFVEYLNAAKDNYLRLLSMVKSNLATTLPHMDEHMCPVCFMLMYPPVRTSCQHSYCLYCFDKLYAVHRQSANFSGILRIRNGILRAHFSQRLASEAHSVFEPRSASLPSQPEPSSSSAAAAFEPSAVRRRSTPSLSSDADEEEEPDAHEALHQARHLFKGIPSPLTGPPCAVCKRVLPANPLMGGHTNPKQKRALKAWFPRECKERRTDAGHVSSLSKWRIAPLRKWREFKDTLRRNSIVAPF